MRKTVLIWALLKALGTFLVVFVPVSFFIKQGSGFMGSVETHPITWGEFYLKIPFGFLFALMCAVFAFLMGIRRQDE